MTPTPLGIVLRHDKTGFAFITREHLKTWEFVHYQTDCQHILCRVAETEPLTEYPVEFLLDTGITPSDVAEFCGFDPDEFKYFMTKGVVIGYFDENLGEFINPRMNPAAGTVIHRSAAGQLREINKAQPGEIGSATIGTIAGTDFKVVLSVKDVVSQHLSVIAATGAGKSYTVGVIVEELLTSRNMAPVLIFDPHGEYTVLDAIANDPRFWDGDYKPKVRIIKPDKIKIRVGDLETSDLISIIDDGTMSDKMKTLFGGACRTLRRDRSKHFTRSELRNAVEKERGDGNDSSIEGILWRLRKLDNKIFHDHEDVPIVDYLQIGQLTVMDVSGISTGFQQMIAQVILQKIFDARQKTENGTYTSATPDKYLPYPVFVILEEAHRFAPQGSGSGAGGDGGGGGGRVAKSKPIIKTILSEGRKFGVGICMVSQRPSKLDSDSLSQCMTQVTMRIINPADQEQIGRSIESVSRDIVSELPALAKGHAIVSGVGINTPTIVRIRQRYGRDRGASKDAPSIWVRGSRTGHAERGSDAILPDHEMDIGV
ncbi:MAG: ATPase [Candidatus Methanogaster sp.]|uniref:ATPase n=1 Tax=Candidatus Methanogaster sp. TaxID=3386292 RepID=A0AC61KYM5_9EURY|nr:MAG: ATPase [ANME-2 cluster archaeon]